jgi:hypothetical protein
MCIVSQLSSEEELAQSGGDIGWGVGEGGKGTGDLRIERGNGLAGHELRKTIET